MPVATIKSKEELEALIKSSTVCLVHFFAPWAEQCNTMNAVIEELEKQKEYNVVKFSKCEAEELPELSLQYKITAVPTILIFKSGQLAGTVNGANAAELTSQLNKIAGITLSENGEQQTLEDRLKALINKSPVVVFMKGNPEQPRCGFSKTLMGILNETKVPFTTFDILQDEDVRQGLKTFSSWPTYPQIYVKGELIGGLDIIKELQQSGELVETLKGN